MFVSFGFAARIPHGPWLDDLPTLPQRDTFGDRSRCTDGHGNTAVDDVDFIGIPSEQPI